MRIFLAVHYTMGGLWVDYELMTTLPDCIVLAKPISGPWSQRLGASALMQGLADGYFVILIRSGPYVGSNPGSGYFH
jgi:succinate dehydrogenase / fumarate reductase flavoprotein subunit